MTEPTPASGQGTGQPAGDPGQPRRRAPWQDSSQQRQAFIDAIVEVSPAVVTVLSIFAALVLGALLIAFTDTTVLHAWSSLFSDPGNAFAQAWDAISAAYSALFNGAIFSPGTVAAAFHGGSVAAIFYPIRSEERRVGKE